MNTPIMQAIETMEFYKHPENCEESKLYNIGIKTAIIELTKLLPAEEAMMKDVWEAAELHTKDAASYKYPVTPDFNQFISQYNKK